MRPVPFFSTLLFAVLAIQAGAQNTLYIHTTGSMNSHNGAQLGIFGSVHNNGTLSSSGGQVYYTGSNAIVVSGDSVIQFDTIQLNVAQQVQLLQELKVSGLMNFTKGYIQTDRSDSVSIFLHFLDNSTHSGSSDSSHVNGVVRKTGNDAFTFPVGHLNHAQSIAISAPSSVSDHYTAFYRQHNPSSYGMSTGSIDSNCGGSNIVELISDKEYWYLTRTSGSSNVILTLYLDEVSGVNNLMEVMPARWTGSQWQSVGSGGSTGSTSEGSLSSGSGCGAVGSPTAISDFGFFTFSAASVSALPVELLHFDAVKYNNDVLLTWTTAMQWNHSHFDIERSTDGTQFNFLTTVEGESFTHETQAYEVFDFNPNHGVNYYRLKQVDLDGTITYSDIRLVNFQDNHKKIMVYPNPTNTLVHIHKENHEEVTGIELYDAVGSHVLSSSFEPGQHSATLNLSHLPTGIYTLTTGTHTSRIIKN